MVISLWLCRETFCNLHLMEFDSSSFFCLSLVQYSALSFFEVIFKLRVPFLV